MKVNGFSKSKTLSGSNRPVVFGILLLLSLAFISVIPLNVAHAQSSYSLYVSSNEGSISGPMIDGYHIVVYQNGQVIQTGFTPTDFSLVAGETYSVQADNYGSCVFAYWYVPLSGFIYSNPMTFTAFQTPGNTNAANAQVVYNCGTSTSTTTTTSTSSTTSSTSSSSSPPQQTATLGVITDTTSGQHIYGINVALWQNGQIVYSCYSSCGLTYSDGVQYYVSVSDNGSECFAYWQGGSTDRFLSVYTNFDGGGQITAYYQPCNVGTASTSQLTITSQDTSGNTLTGYYAVLNQSGTVMATGLTPASFTLNNGQTYTVQVDNYGACNFAYWADTGSMIFYRTVSISSNTSYTAVINCGASTSSTSSSSSSSSVSSSTTVSTNSNSSIATSTISQTTLATTSTQANGSITLYIAIVVVAVVIAIVALAGLFLRRGKSNSS